MAKALETEKEEWLKNNLPDNDGQDEFYQTSAPVIIFQMVDQHLQVTNTIHSEFTFSALVLSIQQITKYGYKYRESIIDFKEKHFKDRSQVMPFSIECHFQIINSIECANLCIFFIRCHFSRNI